VRRAKAVVPLQQHIHFSPSVIMILIIIFATGISLLIFVRFNKCGYIANCISLADVMECSLLKGNWSFRGTCHLHLHGGRVSPARNQHEGDSNQCRIWRRHALSKRRFNSNGLHDIVSQKTEELITTAVRTSDSTYWSWRSFYWRCKYFVDRASSYADATLHS
jgi:hypothetical protein